MTKDNIQELLSLLEFEHDGNVYFKRYENVNEPLKVDISGDGHIYYRECGISIGRETTCNLLEPENLVVLHCVDRLLWKGYSPFHIELEPAWKLGHSAKGGYADVWVRTFKDGGFDGSDDDKDSLLIIECKTWGREFDGAWADTKEDGAQLFSYFQQERATKFLCLYTADIIAGKLEQDYHLINVQDNEEKLANEESSKSYKDATNNKQLYNVWHETYHDDYATRGLFEDEIEPYRIGKNKYTTKDLKSVDNDTIQKKYNEFALILRQHNVGGYENSFDKLVNLFLAKVVDETSNPDDLDFYWKGSAYDDDYRLQDRLQRLYRDGMKRFLNEDVTYIEDGEIEKAFRRFKNDPDATKKTIKSYFRALKFFSDNDFSFISVHNKKLFEQNAAILLKVVKMLQDIKLKDSDQNQLLGDLFEGFLNKGVKQSEGQFFTPMPIVRFLVSSLPLEKIIQNSEEIPSAIDYACGAGHFLTEYAVQIKDYVEKYRPSIPLNEYYAHITGIEKEYRLSKVSKVSAFMYGHDETQIIYSDALVPTENVREGSYDVLIANPPYSVKGFLETLTENQRKHYSLFNDGLNIAKNNAIEIFFIERAAQLLKAGGVAGIILPVSVLNKDGIYAKAREIILQKFDVVALVEFGSGTFGKTGTSTITMFLRRKETNTPDADHYRNRVNSWFSNFEKCDSNIIYEDTDLLEAYCEHCGFEWDDYLSFLSGTMNERLLEHDTIQAYKASFFGNQRTAMKGVCDQAKDIRARFKSRQNTQAYRRLSDEEKSRQEANAFIQFVVAIEKEKVFYFILAKMTPNPVVIVKSPSGTTNMKQFLGYEWSDSKGNEGIKYMNVVTQSSADDEGNGEDDDTLQQIDGIKGIQSPLFNPQNLEDPMKINTIIRDNFNDSDIIIPDELAEYVNAYSLVDLIDFKRTDFTKAIKTTPILSYPQIESKYSLERIGVIAPYASEKVAYSIITPTCYVTTANMLQNRAGVTPYTDTPEVGNVTKYRKGDILVSNIRPYLKKIWLADHDGGCSNDVLVFRNIKTNEYRNEYLYTIMSSDIFFDYMMVGKTGLKMPRGDKKVIPNFRIPKPSMDIQDKIVSKFKEIENDYTKNREIYEECINEISATADGLFDKFACRAIGTISDAPQYGANTSAISGNKDKDYRFIRITDITDDGELNDDWKTVRDFDEQYILKDGDFLFARSGATAGKTFLYKECFGKAVYAGYLIRFRLNQEIVLPDFLNIICRSKNYQNWVLANRQGTARANINAQQFASYEIPLPLLDEQKKIIEETKDLFKKMHEAKAIMDNATSLRQAVLEKYLK